MLAVLEVKASERWPDKVQDEIVRQNALKQESEKGNNVVF